MRVNLFAHALHFSMSSAQKHAWLRPVVRAVNKGLIRLAYRTYQQHGEKGWEAFWIPAFTKYGQLRANYIARVMKIDPSCPRSIGRYHDFEDPVFGVTGHWERNEYLDPVRVETSCPACDQLMALTKGQGCGSFCRNIILAMELNTGTSLNRDYYVEVESLLTEGDETCRFIHKIKCKFDQQKA
jgi:hypothetical protein